MADAREDTETLIASTIGIAEWVVNLAKSAKRNRQKCDLLREQVQNTIFLLTDLESQWTPDQVTNGMVRSLRDALIDANDLMGSCQEKRTWSLVFKTQKKAKKLDALGARISIILEQFHIANMVLIVNINKEKFLMDIIDKLLGACKRLPQSAKERLKSYMMSSFASVDRISSDADKRVLVERIFSELTRGVNDDVAATRTITPSVSPEPAGGRGGDDDDDERAGDADHELVRFARSIVDKAKDLRQHGREEIQLLVRFVQQAADITKTPEVVSELLSRDLNTSLMVDDLRRELEEADRIVCNYPRYSHRRRAQAFLCGVDGGLLQRQPDHIQQVAYRIEYYVLHLTVIAVRQMRHR